MVVTKNNIIVIKERCNNPDQVSLFEEGYREWWNKSMLSIAEQFKGPFWPSDLKRKCAIAPDHASQWGVLYRALRRLGYHKTGLFRPSHSGSRNGGVEFQWANSKS